MKIKEIYENINWKAFIIGAAFFAFIAVLGVENNLDMILIFSSIGLLYIGYTSQNIAQGSILGAAGTLPLFIVTITTERLGKISGSGEAMIFWILIVFLIMGAFCGFVGSYFKQKQIKMQKQRKDRI